MIISHLQGGLGNQMFQIAVGLSLSYDLETEFCVSDVETVDRERYFTSKYTKNIFRNLVRKDISKLINNLRVWNEPSCSFYKIPIIDNLYLNGYFQSEKYFKNHEQKIKDFFIVDKAAIPKNSVALHVRRGDYLKNPNFHNILPIEYYQNALDYIKNYDKLFIFSSDGEIPKEFNFPNMELVNTGDDYLDFSIMSSCDHNITANSTFSWWASWLNKNDDKKIVVPSKWFGPYGPQNWKDIYCDNWKII